MALMGSESRLRYFDAFSSRELEAASLENAIGAEMDLDLAGYKSAFSFTGGEVQSGNNGTDRH
ncbi:hypothetical protein [Bradyrhizobium sp. dw_78]|uniref:hypothetical protein n=1 Tax=Bradyrhizobium sp. dw_78 TaxID=2719793 RepID=UPI001BD304DE|nr:hypothetical protein [Bradyrhizobium sp. dw_78]